MNRDRYLRQQGVEGLAAERLRALRATVVGAGAIGNEVVKNLALMGVGSIDLHDFDTVEIHNLTRSVFLRESDVGQPKAGSVAARARDVDPSVRIDAIEGDFWRTASLSRLAARDVVIAAVDSLEARMRISMLARLAGADLVVAGIDSRHASVETFPYSAGDDVACYECHLPASAYAKVAKRYSCGWLRRALAREDVVPTTAITASMAGALAVQAALRVGGDAPAGRRVHVDTRSGHAAAAALARNPECAACADLVPRPRRVPAAGDWLRALATHAPGTDVVRLSDPIVAGYACATCGAADDERRYVGRPADRFDDRIATCAACGERGVRIDIRAEIDVATLRNLSPAGVPPAKFLLAALGTDAAVCLDLTE